jgi:hypothetical protein
MQSIVDPRQNEILSGLNGPRKNPSCQIYYIVLPARRLTSSPNRLLFLLAM